MSNASEALQILHDRLNADHAYFAARAKPPRRVMADTNARVERIGACIAQGLTPIDPPCRAALLDIGNALMGDIRDRVQADDIFPSQRLERKVGCLEPILAMIRDFELCGGTAVDALARRRVPAIQYACEIRASVELRKRPA